ncbi:MAG TPA: hypothetical protein VMW12_05300 [Candidatus Dormibacteraeota bacterium]|nr:hypothetical protein [Candidatus Dormibacteraeota bacterium]
MKQRTRAPLMLRLAGRITVMLVAMLLFSLAGIQFARLIDQNIAMAHELSATQADIGALKLRRERQLRELRRLRDPEGAIPDIHERLRLVGPKEEMIFVSPAPSAEPSTAP